MGEPTLIECHTYRTGLHNTSDNPKEYRDQAVLDDAAQRDPIERVRRFATRDGIWSAAQETAALDEIRSEIEVAQREVETLPKPGTAARWANVIRVDPPRGSRMAEPDADRQRVHS